VLALVRPGAALPRRIAVNFGGSCSAGCLCPCWP